jgi:hypothetical protein
MVPKDRREEAGSPNNIKVQVPTEEETAEPRTAVPTPTHRRPETGPQLLGRGPSRSASHPTEVNLRQGELTEIPKLQGKGETTAPQQPSTLPSGFEATNLRSTIGPTNRAGHSAQHPDGRGHTRRIEDLTSIFSFAFANS